MHSTDAPLELRHPQSTIVAALRDPAIFGPECSSVKLLETHISYVILTGHFAYKIKKAIAFPFVDFSSLAARRRCCEDELRLNRRTAADLYLDVVSITEDAGHFTIGGPGEVVEWAVRMREFGQENLLSRMLARGELTGAHVDWLATTIAHFHDAVDRAPAGGVFGSPGDTLDLALDNFTGIRPLLDDPAARDVAEQLRDWTSAEHAVCSEMMSARQRDGFVRECHGDLHLGNVVCLDGRPTPFDCLEFSARLRWCDVMSEIAFTTMDLRARGRSDLARRFLNAYLEMTGDYAGLPLLRFYVVYRALVRAKVACLRAAQTHDGGVDAHREGRSYLDLASGCATRHRPSIVVMHGLAASGKTSASQQLLERADFIRIRSDVERKRLQGLAARTRTGSPIAAGIYASDTTHATYLRLRDLASTAVAAGQSVVVDATFLHRWQRQLFRELASSMRIPFTILSLSADESVIRERLARRLAGGSDASEADSAVLAYQLRTQEPLAAEEQASAVTCACEARLAKPIASARLTDALDQVIARCDLPGPGRHKQGRSDPSLAADRSLLSPPDS